MSLSRAHYCGFSLSHGTIKTIQQIKARIKEEKEHEYSHIVAKIQVCAMVHAGDIQRNVLLKFIRLCMETPCLCPSEGHKQKKASKKHMSSSFL